MLTDMCNINEVQIVLVLWNWDNNFWLAQDLLKVQIDIRNVFTTLLKIYDGAFLLR